MSTERPAEAVESADNGERSSWVPPAAAAGTELIVAGLRQRLGRELQRINLQVNHPAAEPSAGPERPRVVWLHHDVNQVWVQWCRDSRLVQSVDAFVFVSSWQRERYLREFGLPAERCHVLRHALEPDPPRRWEPAPDRVWRCAYTSTPFRGLDVLLAAWERLKPPNGELHVWSSMKLYRVDDAPYEALYRRAEALPGVTYHAIVPNPELRRALRQIDFLAYPSTFAETACLSVIEAMAAGCRVVVPSLGALPETSGGYARLYPSLEDPQRHAAVFADQLAAEFAQPWRGCPELSLAQQQHCAAVYSWPNRLAEWRELIDSLAPASRTS